MSYSDTVRPSETGHLPGRWIAMAVLLIAGFMNLIDVTIVNVALPSMLRAFHATPSQIEWVVAAYILTFALCLLPAGRLGDIFGRRRMFVAGVSVFTLGSALCGMAPTIEVLVASRVFQAVGGAMMTPQTLAIVPALFSPRERGGAYALFGLSSGLASVAGPVAGGFLIGQDIWGLGWRPIFLVNVPIGVLAVLAALKFVPKLERHPDGRIDFAGIILAGASLLLVIFPLIEGREAGWPAWCFAMMGLALAGAVLFVLHERRQQARGGAQLLPAVLLGNRSYMLGTGMNAVMFSGIPGFFMIIAIYLQAGYGLDPLHSGLTTLPYPLGMLAASLVSGRLGARWQRQRVMAGTAMMALAMLWLRAEVGAVGDSVDWSLLAPALTLAGMGLGTAVSPMYQLVLANIEGRDTGSASGAMQAFQQVGSAFGVAIIGEIFFARLAAAGQPGALPHAVFAAAFAQAIVYAVLVFAAIALLIWLLPKPQAHH